MRMMGLFLDRRTTSLNPACLKAETVPVQTKASGVFSIVGSVG